MRGMFVIVHSAWQNSTMPGPPEDLLRRARERRELAARLRRLAGWISLNADQARMLQQAQELEAEAAHLEQQAVAGDPKPIDPKDSDPKS